MIFVTNMIFMISKSFNNLNQKNHSSDKKIQPNPLPLAVNLRISKAIAPSIANG
jgi:hypothetical protein